MARNKVVATYDYYTLEQAREILAKEIKQDFKRKIARKRREERVYFFKQKCVGLIMLITTGILFLISRNILVCFPFFCIGLCCFSRLHLIYD